jgi:hypothetical protein
MEHVSVFTDPSDLRKMQGHLHHKMKRVKILGFTSAKSLVELTCHFLESITPLEHLMLEAYQSCARCFVPDHNSRKCSPKSLVELTCHFLESITSLEHLMLEAYQSCARCFVPAHNSRKCSPLPVDVLREAQRGLLAIRTYNEPKVPSMVKLYVSSSLAADAMLMLNFRCVTCDVPPLTKTVSSNQNHHIRKPR